MINTNAIKTILVGTIGMLLLNACNDKAKNYAANDPVYKNIDTTVKPGDDFFQYANGDWLKKNPIPPAYAAGGIGNVVNEELRDRLKKITEDALNANAANGGSAPKIVYFYS